MKKTIREEVLKKRDGIPNTERLIKDNRIKLNILNLPEFVLSKNILIYASFRSEVSTSSIIEEALKAGKRVVLPRVNRDRHELELYEIRDKGELSPGYAGIMEPFRSKERSRNLNDMDLIIVPGVAFDSSGNRIGYGGGYYDGLLSRMPAKISVIALAYEEQLVDSVPSEIHDIKVDIIVTDKRVIKIHRQ
ncbi:MAG: 5-formyltetrahydrofolate cyclo-ligase [Nitrospirota bacterium]